MDDAPKCPACGVVATWLPEGNEFVEGGCWETVHKLDCSWMRDPDSERYDDHDTWRVTDE